MNYIIVDKNKRAILPWKEYQTRLITDEEYKAQQYHPKAYGRAVICGKISGGLEVIDVDAKNDPTGAMKQSLLDAIREQSAELHDRLHLVQTQNDGLHISYLCDTIEGNQKLASRYATDEEQRANPHVKQVVLIETRGEGGYVVTPPTDGYFVIRGEDVPTITPDERELLLSICRQYNQVYEEPVKPRSVTTTKEFGLSPFEDFNQRGDAVALLTNNGWTIVRETAERVIMRRPGKTEGTSGDYLKDKRWFSVFTTSTQFEPHKAYNPAAVFCILECNGDWKRAAAKLSEQHYGEKKQYFAAKMVREIFYKIQDGCSQNEIISFLVKKYDKSIDEAKDIYETLLNQWGENISTFWDVKDVKNDPVISINLYKLKQFLSYTGGFFLYFYDNNTNLYKIIQIKDGLVSEASTEKIKKYIVHYINSLPSTFDFGCTPDMLMEKILHGCNIYFSNGFFEFLESIKPDFLRSTKDLQYFAFKNGIVEINEKNWFLKTYGEIQKVVWEKQVIDYNISIDQDFDTDSCEFFRFLDKISDNDETRRNNCLRLIGYLLHSYKDPARPYAVILAEETENDTAGGGTGKGLFIKGLSQLARTVKLDGKTFKIDANFALQRVNLDTQIIAVEDCEKNLDFEKFNSQITEGTTIDKKNKDQLFIDYKDAPKFMFSTNYMLNIKGNHGKRRTRVFEFSNYFGTQRTPLQEFGHLLFDEWDADEWNRFYNLMFFCVSLYLDKGLAEVKPSLKLKKKQLKNQFGEEFLHYLEDWQTGVWHVFGSEHKSFMSRFDLEKREYSARRFKKAIETAAETFDMGIEWQKNRQNNNLMEFRLASNVLNLESSNLTNIEF